MAHTENTLQNLKNKHLSLFKAWEIAALHKAGHFISIENSQGSQNIFIKITNELKRGTLTQLKI